MSIIKSFSVGQGDIKGDMFYIKHDSDNFTIIDCCLDDDNKEQIVEEIIEESKGKGITRFISTHPDEDHIQQIEYLDDKISILNFYCVKNEATKKDYSTSFERYCRLRDSEKAFYIHKGCSRKWMNIANEERGSSGISILWPNTENEHFKEVLKKVKEGESPNNISPIIKYSLEDGVKVLWMGDLETDFMEKINDELENIEVDILFAPHHGRDSGKVPEALLKKINPKLIIIGEAPSEHLNYYRGYNTIKQNSAGDIVFDCLEGKVNIYVSNENYSEEFLENEKLDNLKDLTYIGTLLL